MSSSAKIEANRRNAHASTGPRTPEGKAAVARNARTHGLRSKATHLSWEPAHAERIFRTLVDEWKPKSHSECNCVEQMAVAEAKLLRYEKNMTHVLYQSEFVKRLGSENQYVRTQGQVEVPDMLSPHEFDAQSLINGVSNRIAGLERAWHKALDTLLKLQDRRRQAEIDSVLKF